jgi:hypothetical protein
LVTGYLRPLEESDGIFGTSLCAADLAAQGTG